MLSKEERLEKQSIILHKMRYELPKLITMSPPRSVSSEDWFKESGLGKVLEVVGMPMFRQDGLNGKGPPAFKVLCEEEAAGCFDDKPVGVVPGSGNFGACCGSFWDAFNLAGLHAVVDSTTPEGKLKQLRMSGTEPIVAPAGINPVEHAQELAQEKGKHLIHQYLHWGSVRGQQWTAEQIIREFNDMKWLGAQPSLFGAVPGTGAGVLGGHRYLRPAYPGMKVFAVASMSDEEKVPGSRSPKGLAYVKKIGGFPLEDALDLNNKTPLTSVKKDRAFEVSLEYIRQWIGLGPTGGLLVARTYDLLRKIWETEGAPGLEKLKNDAGKIVVILLLMDNYLPYVDLPEYETACRSLAARS